MTQILTFREFKCQRNVTVDTTEDHVAMALTLTQWSSMGGWVGDTCESHVTDARGGWEQRWVTCYERSVIESGEIMNSDSA